LVEQISRPVNGGGAQVGTAEIYADSKFNHFRSG
jgi:hypothetical protein